MLYNGLKGRHSYRLPTIIHSVLYNNPYCKLIILLLELMDMRRLVRGSGMTRTDFPIESEAGRCVFGGSVSYQE